MSPFRLMRLGALLATVTLATGVAMAASPASASTTGMGSCTLVAPKTLAITSPYKAVTLRLASDCAASGVEYATWDLYHPTQGWDGMTIFDGNTTDIWDVYDWDLKPGSRYTWRASYAWDSDYNDVVQTQPYTDVKLGSKASLTTSRSGKYVTLKASTSHYSSSADGYVRWGGARGTIQYLGTKGWTTLRTVSQSSTGYSTAKVYAPKARSYRVVFGNTTTIWGSTTAASRR